MSADNYYFITAHPKGGYAAVMGFASDDERPRVDERHWSFPSIADAYDWASEQYTEYGVMFDRNLDLETKKTTKHDPLCSNIPCSCEPDDYGHEWTCRFSCQCAFIGKVREDQHRETLASCERSFLAVLGDNMHAMQAAGENKMADGVDIALTDVLREMKKLLQEGA